jgi:hypothetical protein
MKTIALSSLFGFIALFHPVPIMAGEVDVVQVELTRTGDGNYRAAVTVRHADEGWDHYANAWEVVAPDGTILATRILAHPHVNEQPFKRSLSGIIIPENIKKVRFRAKDSVHGYGGKEIVLPVNR